MREVLVNLYWTLDTDFQRQSLELSGVSIEQLVLQQPPNGLFPFTFEQLLAAFRDEAQLFTEPDGSFSIGGRIANEDWSCGGMIYDAGEAVAYVEFYGAAPNEVWERMLQAIRDIVPQDAAGMFLMYLKAEGVFMTLGEFQRWIAAQQS